MLAAGKCWYQANDLPRAQSALTSALTRKFDDAADAAYWLGQTLLKQNKPGDALAVLDRAIADYPKSPFLPELSFTRVNALYEQPGRRKETVGLFMEFARKYPQHELARRATYMAALAALGTQDYGNAQVQAEWFLKAFPRHELTPDVLFIGGEAYVGAATPAPAKAETLFRRLVAEYPRHKHAAEGRVRIGLCLLMAKKYPEAVTSLTESAKEMQNPALVAEKRLYWTDIFRNSVRDLDLMRGMYQAYGKAF